MATQTGLWGIAKNVEPPPWASDYPNSIQCNRTTRQIFAQKRAGVNVLHTYADDEQYQRERKYARNWAKLGHKHVTIFDVEETVNA